MRNTLTPAEMRILEFLSQGKQSREIAEILFISDSTIKNHKSNMCLKLGFKSTTELMIYAVKNATLLQMGGGKKDAEK